MHKNIFDEVSEALQELVKNLLVGNPTDETTDIGPLISTEERDRVAAWVNEALSAGACKLSGGNAFR